MTTIWSFSGITDGYLGRYQAKQKLSPCPLRQGFALEAWGELTRPEDILLHGAYMAATGCLGNLAYEPPTSPEFVCYVADQLRRLAPFIPITNDGLGVGQNAAIKGHLDYLSNLLYWNPDKETLPAYTARVTGVILATLANGMPTGYRVSLTVGGSDDGRFLTRNEAAAQLNALFSVHVPEYLDVWGFPTNPNGTLKVYDPSWGMVAEAVARANAGVGT